MSDYLVGTVLVHPDDNPGHPDARRLIRRAVGPGEWPWTRLTGWPADLPRQHGDLSAWVPQHLQELAVVLGHPAWRAAAE